MRFLIDAQLPPALVHVLIAAGHQANHVEDIGLREAEDLEIWRVAADNGSVLIIKDEDFAARSSGNTAGPAVISLRIGNSSNRALREWFEPLLPRAVAMLEAGERLIEVR